jgi:predicted transglutaminase-like cysteine proteinase
MVLGAAATPPPGFVDFCERMPAECNVSRPELAEMRVEVNQAASGAAVSAITYDWSAVFKRPATAAATSRQIARVDEQGRVTTVSDNTLSGVTVTAPAKSTVLPMTRETWALLKRVNDTVNLAIIPQDDEKTYGVPDYWAEPIESGVRYGDCEDYVLDKRHALIAQGVPAQALSIAVVKTFKSETHAVLVVATSTGDYVLDNRTPWILPWSQTSYLWRERQVAGSASRWAFAAVSPEPGHGSFLIASSR